MTQDKPIECVLYIKMMTPVSLNTFMSRLEFFIKMSHEGPGMPKIKVFQADATAFTVSEEVVKFEKYTDFPYWMLRLVMMSNQINSKTPPIEGLGKLFVDVENRPSQTFKKKSREDVTVIFQPRR